MSSPSEITDLLIRWSTGDRAALEQLMPLVERELRRMAHLYMRRERKGHTLETSGLINETFLRLVDQSRVKWQNRAHFFGIAAQKMRQVLSNYARDRQRQKRGGGVLQVSLGDIPAISTEKSAELIALDEALEKLTVIDERKCRVVELRYFAGLSVEETAAVLGVSTATINRDWKIARVWLLREIQRGGN